MTEYQKGQRVRVEFDAVVVAVHEVTQSAVVVQAHGRNTWVYPKWAKITPLDPPDWPPQVGDIWEAEGQEWFARRHSYTPDTILVPENGASYPNKTPGVFKALNPVLVRRRGQ